jgi:hypothetical protein
MMAIYWQQPPRLPKATTKGRAYTLVVRGPDGLPRCESFDDAASYLARVMTLQRSTAESLPLEDILSVLDALK